MWSTFMTVQPKGNERNDFKIKCNICKTVFTGEVEEFVRIIFDKHMRGH